MKEFLVYTGLRILLFLAALGVVLGLWVLIAGEANLLAGFVIALLISGIGSYVLLNGPREALARKHGNVTAVVQQLGVPRKTLYDKLTRYGIDPGEYRRRTTDSTHRLPG